MYDIYASSYHINPIDIHTKYSLITIPKLTFTPFSHTKNTHSFFFFFTQYIPLSPFNAFFDHLGKSEVRTAAANSVAEEKKNSEKDHKKQKSEGGGGGRRRGFGGSKGVVIYVGKFLFGCDWSSIEALGICFFSDICSLHATNPLLWSSAAGYFSVFSICFDAFEAQKDLFWCCLLWWISHKPIFTSYFALETAYYLIP